MLINYIYEKGQSKMWWSIMKKINSEHILLGVVVLILVVAVIGLTFNPANAITDGKNTIIPRPTATFPHPTVTATVNATSTATPTATVTVPPTPTVTI